MSILILTTREQAGCNEIMEVALDTGMNYLKGIAEQTEGVVLDWLNYPHLPNSQYAISPLYPKKFYSIQEWSVPTGVQSMEKGRIYLPSTITIPNATLSPIQLGSQSYMEGLVLNSGRIEIETTGIYKVCAQIRWQLGGNIRAALITVNGTAKGAFYTGESTIANDGLPGYTQVVWEGQLEDGDLIGISGWQESTVALQVIAGTDSTWLAIHRIE